MTQLDEPPQCTRGIAGHRSGGVGSPELSLAVQVAVTIITTRLAEDRRACDTLADLLRRLGRRPEDDPEYVRWCRATHDLDAHLADALAGR